MTASDCQEKCPQVRFSQVFIKIGRPWGHARFMQDYMIIQVLQFGGNVDQKGGNERRGIGACGFVVLNEVE